MTTVPNKKKNNYSLDNDNTEDPYWDFDKDKHFRPQLNKGDFFKLTGFDFGWFVLEPISQFVGTASKDGKNIASLPILQLNNYIEKNRIFV
jgi:hypothetical protein